MMQIINALIISTLAGISTVIGSFIIFLNIKSSDNFISFCLSFSAIIMLGISIFELFPSSFIFLLNKYSFIILLIIISTLFIMGKGSINIINKMINNSNNLYKIGILNMIILILHNFPEGITTFATSINNINLGIKISFAIMLHNIPEGIVIAYPIYYSTGSKLKAINKTLLSGISEPIGALFGYIILKDYINEYMISFLFIIVSILMIVLSIEYILPETYKYKNNKYIILGLILGILVVGLSLFLF